MHVRVAGLINLIGVVARPAKEKEETAELRDSPRPTVRRCAAHALIPRTRTAASDVLKGREANPFSDRRTFSSIPQ